MKLESKHLAPYEKGASGVKIKLSENGLRNLWDIDEDTRFLQGEFTISFIDYENNTLQIRSAEDERYTYEEIELDWIKLITRPLSDLTKEIEGVGMPIMELAKIALPEWNWKGLLDWHINKNLTCLELNFPQEPDKVFNNVSGTLDFYGTRGNDLEICSNQLDLFQWLFKYHFDVFGLIEKGLAIDINTIEL